MQQEEINVIVTFHPSLDLGIAKRDNNHETGWSVVSSGM